MQAGAATPWFVDSVAMEAALMPAVFRRLLPGHAARRARLPRCATRAVQSMATIGPSAASSITDALRPRCVGYN
jgi:hypothetical protein